MNRFQSLFRNLSKFSPLSLYQTKYKRLIISTAITIPSISCYYYLSNKNEKSNLNFKQNAINHLLEASLFHFSMFPKSLYKKIKTNIILGNALILHCLDNGGVFDNIPLAAILISYDPEYFNLVFEALHEEKELNKLELMVEPTYKAYKLLNSMIEIYVDEFSYNDMKLTLYKDREQYLENIMKLVNYFNSLDVIQSSSLSLCDHDYRLKDIINLYEKINHKKQIQISQAELQIKTQTE